MHKLWGLTPPWLCFIWIFLFTKKTTTHVIGTPPQEIEDANRKLDFVYQLCAPEIEAIETEVNTIAPSTVKEMQIKKWDEQLTQKMLQLDKGYESLSEGDRKDRKSLLVRIQALHSKLDDMKKMFK